MFYKKGLDISNTKEMFEFLKGHFTYDTMNSWNGLRSIANNVKIYNLDLDGDCWNALRYLEDDEYFNINSMIEDWEAEHPNYKVGFNGRSGGYLVLYNKKGNGNVLPDIIIDTEDYEAFKEECTYYYGGVKHYKQELREYVELVRDFDKLCDELRNYVNELSLRSFTDDKIEVLMDDFVYDYKDDMNYMGVKYPEILATETADLIQIQIDPAMRELRSLMDCFFNALRTDYWKTVDDGSEIIKLKIC